MKSSATVTEQSNATVWFWLRPDRKQVQGSLSELRALLAGRALPRSTLVWIEPWSEWLPASRVPELASALPANSLGPTAQAPAAHAPTAHAAGAPRPTPKSSLPPLRAAAKPLAPRPEASTGRALPPLAEVQRKPARPVGPPPPPSREARSAQASEPSITELPETLLVEEVSSPTAAPRVEPEQASAAVETQPAAAEPEPLPQPIVVESVPEPPVEQPLPEALPLFAAEPVAEVPAVVPLPLPFPPPPEPLPPPPVVEALPALEPLPVAALEALPSEQPALPAAEPPVEVTAASSELPHDSVALKVAEPLPRNELAELLPRRVGSISEAPVELAPREEDSLRPRKRSARATVSLFAAAWGAAGLVLVLALLPFAKRQAEPPIAAAATKDVTPPPTTKTEVTPSCALTVSASKLAESTERSVLPSVVATGPHGALLGFAAAPTRAQGLQLDLESLDQASPFEQNGDRAVLRVSPSGASAAAAFDVERDDGALKLTRAAQGAPGVALGFAGGHLVRRSNGQNDDLWAVEAEGATEPRSARINQDLEAVVFRQGGLGVGQSGQSPAAAHQAKLRFGWFAPEGATKVSALQELDAGAQQIGTPSVSANGAGAVIAFAARNADGEPWRLRLSAAKANDMAESPVAFAMSEQDFGGGAIAPSLTSLPGGRWALQWTQGTSGRYRVLVQLLGPDLKAQGPVVAVSPMGANAGQGSLWAIGDRVLSLFVLPVPGKDELWGAVLECR